MKEELNSDEIMDLFKGILDSPQIATDNIPDIDLYMDQVIQIFDNYLNDRKRNDGDKILTKTMINNYTKDKIILPVKDKKYSKNHILLLLMVYEMKQSIAITDIKKILEPLTQDGSFENSNCNIGEIFKKYQEAAVMQKKNQLDILESIMNNVNEVFAGEDSDDYGKLMVIILLLINASNINRRLVELITDKIL